MNQLLISIFSILFLAPTFAYSALLIKNATGYSVVIEEPEKAEQPISTEPSGVNLTSSEAINPIVIDLKNTPVVETPPTSTQVTTKQSADTPPKYDTDASTFVVKDQINNTTIPVAEEQPKAADAATKQNNQDNEQTMQHIKKDDAVKQTKANPPVINEAIPPEDKLTELKPIKDYVGISTGLLFPMNNEISDRNGNTATVSYNRGLTLSGYVGRKFGNRFRLEGEVNYLGVSFNEFNATGLNGKLNSDLWSVGVISNGYYDLPISKLFTPYLVVGLGFKSIFMSRAEVNGAKIWNKDYDAVFAYQLGIGGGVEITKNTILDVSYRYNDTGDIKIDQIKTEFKNHNILLGIRYLLR